MKALPLLLTAVLTLSLATALPAQQPGDSVRVWNGPGSNMVGRLIRADSLAVVFREGAGERTVPRSEVLRVDVWKPRNHAVEIAIDAVLGGLIASSWEQDPLVGAGAGVMLGVASVSLWPGRWRRIWRR